MLNPPLHEKAFALRPVRAMVKENEFRFYECVTFPKDPFHGIEQSLRRCFGNLVEDDAELMIDILDENNDIIQEYPINRKGFEYLRRVLKFRVDSTPSNIA